MKTTILKKHLKYKIPQIKVAIVCEKMIQPPRISNGNDLIQYLEPLRYASEEYFITLYMDGNLQITGYNEVSHGTLNQSLVHPREVFKAAILANAFSIIVAHNHPAGSLEPSAEDLQSTNQLAMAGRLLGIPLQDHIIITATDFTSIRQQYPDIFEAA